MARRLHQIGSRELGAVLAAACPPEYYVFGLPINVDLPSLRVLELRDGAYVQVGYAEGDQALTVERPFPVTVVPAGLVEV